MLDSKHSLPCFVLHCGQPGFYCLAFTKVSLTRITSPVGTLGTHLSSPFCYIHCWFFPRFRLCLNFSVSPHLRVSSLLVILQDEVPLSALWWVSCCGLSVPSALAHILSSHHCLCLWLQSFPNGSQVCRVSSGPRLCCRNSHPAV